MRLRIILINLAVKSIFPSSPHTNDRPPLGLLKSHLEPRAPRFLPSGDDHRRLIGAIAANFSGDQSAKIDRSSLQKIDRTWVSQINRTD